jgi:hypothetical protein
MVDKGKVNAKIKFRLLTEAYLSVGKSRKEKNMNTFWLKIAVFTVVAAGIIILVSVFSSSAVTEKTPVSEKKPAVKEKTFSDVAAADDKRLRAEPEVQKPAESGRQELKLEFRKLEPEEDAQAGELFEMALFQRKEGRLPGMSYKLMVDYCREIITQFPGSIYAYKAKRMLSDIPAEQRQRYHVTEEEINLSPGLTLPQVQAK